MTDAGAPPTSPPRWLSALLFVGVWTLVGLIFSALFAVACVHQIILLTVGWIIEPPFRRVWYRPAGALPHG